MRHNPTRISRRFAELRESGELGIVAYITAGDPSLDATLRYVLALAEAGADVIELGIPFSDPLADGPTIQRASERALKAGTTLASVLELVRRIRQSSQVPIDAFRLLQSGFSDGAGEICGGGERGGRGWRVDDRSDAGRIGRIPANHGGAQSRHGVSGRADFNRRAAGEDFASAHRDSCI